MQYLSGVSLAKDYFPQSDGFTFIHAGGRTADDIVTWLAKKTGPPAKELTTADEIKEFTAKSDVMVVGFYKDKESDAAKAFIEAAQGIDDIEFGIVHDEALAKDNNVEGDNFVLFKKVQFSFWIENSISDVCLLIFAFLPLVRHD